MTLSKATRSITLILFGHIFIVVVSCVLVGMLLVISGAVVISKSELTLADLGVWVGSLATVSTLIFLTYQQVKTSERQQILDEQQRYKEHKQDFYEALDSLESSDNVKVTERFHLYHKIYNLGHENKSITHLSIIRYHIKMLLSSIENLKSVEHGDSPLKIINSLFKIEKSLNITLMPYSTIGRDGDILIGNDYVVNIFDLNSEISILLDSYNKLVWVVDRSHENIEVEITLNPDDKVRVLLSTYLINDIVVKLNLRYLLLAHIYLLLVDEQIGSTPRNELHPFRKEVSYLFEQGPNVFTTFEDDDYYQGEVSKSISYLKENESYINEKSRLEEIYVLSEKVLVKPV
ncbi:TPA: hypothetical protein ACVU44_004947 [Vibrio parahaemolyticus]|uniref:hypothetical protein n=4 Tax=Vibrio harveyi group TaxID=717610 RepID=UPI001C92F436|nr:hypothetical protein [Vibrio alginolyticus]MBY4646659.1 hypothetical protein [Vibrio alginolyticus]